MATRNSDLVVPVELIEPKDITGAAQTGTYVDVSGAENFAIQIQVGDVISTADDMTVTVKQATDTSGTSTKALAFTEAYSCSSSAKTAVTVSSNSFTIDSDDDNKIFVIPLRQQALDANNSFKTVTVSITSPGSNAVLLGATLQVAAQRYNKQV